MPSSILERLSRWSVCILAGAILAGALTLGTARTAHAETQPCKISALQVAPDKYVLIRCFLVITNPRYFLVPATNPSANRVLSVASMAALLNKNVIIIHDGSPAGTTGICPDVPAVCRLIREIHLSL